MENERALKNIIMDYCRASEQRLNTGKSTITFNRQADASLHSTIEDELNIPSSSDLGKYLGLPSMWGRSKKAALGYLKTRGSKQHQWVEIEDIKPSRQRGIN